MTTATFHGRNAIRIGNGIVTATILPGGAYLAGIELVSGPAAGINPLWEVPWASMEPAAFRPARDLDAYGGPPEGRLLASIMGHNLCLDFFGSPSAAEEDAGLVVHGEAGVTEWTVAEAAADRLVLAVELPYAGLRVRRIHSIAAGSATLHVETSVSNLRERGREIGWQEHATFGPPFLVPGVTAFDAAIAKAAVFGEVFAARHRLKPGQEFTWPHGPGVDGKPLDLRVFADDTPYGDFTTQLLDPGSPQAWFTATNPKLGLSCRYDWPRVEYPWLGMWDEHRDRLSPPWSGRTEARGLEFGVSPDTRGKVALKKLGSLWSTPVLAVVPPSGTITKRFQVTLTASAAKA